MRQKDAQGFLPYRAILSPLYTCFRLRKAVERRVLTNEPLFGIAYDVMCRDNGETHFAHALVARFHDDVRDSIPRAACSGQ